MIPLAINPFNRFRLQPKGELTAEQIGVVIETAASFQIE
jgi:hypothetical protein